MHLIIPLNRNRNEFFMIENFFNEFFMIFMIEFFMIKFFFLFLVFLQLTESEEHHLHMMHPC